MQAIQQAWNPLLVIDDSSTIRRSAEIFLGQAGYTVVLAEDGFAALSVILECKPALVFCDIQMPRLDGFQTCALIRRHPEFRHVPVVLLSSRDGVFDRARGVLAGASAYLTKPFTKESLLRTVSEQLAAASSLRPATTIAPVPASSSEPTSAPTSAPISASTSASKTASPSASPPVSPTTMPMLVPAAAPAPAPAPASASDSKAAELSLLITDHPSP